MPRVKKPLFTPRSMKDASNSELLMQICYDGQTRLYYQRRLQETVESIWWLIVLSPLWFPLASIVAAAIYWPFVAVFFAAIGGSAGV